MHIQSGHSSPRQNAFNFGSTKCIAQSPLNNTASPLRRRQPPPPLHLCNSGENNRGFYIVFLNKFWDKLGISRTFFSFWCFTFGCGSTENSVNIVVDLENSCLPLCGRRVGIDPAAAL